jgi:hypothetical protein
MIAPGLFVIVKLLPLEENDTLPAATLPPDGFANSGAADAAKAAPTANERRRRRGTARKRPARGERRAFRDATAN